MKLSKSAWIPSAILGVVCTVAALGYVVFKRVKKTNGFVVLGVANQIISACVRPQTHYVTNLPWHAMMRNNWSDIYFDYIRFSRRFYQPRLASVHEFNKNLDDDKPAWRVVWLRVYSEDTALARSPYFKRTMELINSIPQNVSVAFFSVLEPGKRIPPHVGFYRGVLRYHLALEVPPHSPTLGAGDCFLRVDDAVLRWSAGGDLLFDDVYEHEVQNNTNGRRVILFLDIERPLPFPLSLANRYFIRTMRYSPEVIKTSQRADILQSLPVASARVRALMALVDEQTGRDLLVAQEALHRAALQRVAVAWIFCSANMALLSEFGLDDFGGTDTDANIATDVRTVAIAAAGIPPPPSKTRAPPAAPSGSTAVPSPAPSATAPAAPAAVFSSPTTPPTTPGPLVDATTTAGHGNGPPPAMQTPHVGDGDAADSAALGAGAVPPPPPPLTTVSDLAPCDIPAIRVTAVDAPVESADVVV